MRLLLVEDNHRLSHSLSRGLVDEGYAVDVAYDGKKAKCSPTSPHTTPSLWI